ncbi:MAG: hypothetical protein AB1489_31725 [Acidobacteriota bacterium]
MRNKSKSMGILIICLAFATLLLYSTSRLQESKSELSGVQTFALAGSSAQASGDFQLTVSPTTHTLSPGTSGSSIINIRWLDADPAPVTLSATISPPESTIQITFAPEVVYPESARPFSASMTINTSPNTPQRSYTITIIATSGQNTHSARVQMEVRGGTTIGSAGFSGRKNRRFTLIGNQFSRDSRVVINEIDQTSQVTAVTNKWLTLKGSPETLGIRQGENTIQVIDENGNASNKFIFIF